jgi:hypothetical protein
VLIIEVFKLPVYEHVMETLKDLLEGISEETLEQISEPRRKLIKLLREILEKD